MIKRLMALLALLVTTLGLGLAATSGSAQAYASCPSTSICFYDGYNGNYRIVDHDAADRPGCFNIVPNNVISSVDNNSTLADHDIRVYTNSEDCTGVSGLIYANTEGNMSGQWDNSINSVWIY